MDFGLLPYNFEPEYSAEELQRQAQEETESKTTDRRCECQCGHCRFDLAITEEERTCCTNSDLTIPNMEDFTCIIEHPSFDNIVLNRDVLKVAFVQSMAYKRTRSRAPAEPTNRQYRLTAYRQFVCWMLQGEKLGRGVRIPVPSCVLEKIRDNFPEENRSQYTGFRFQSLDELF